MSINEIISTLLPGLEDTVQEYIISLINDGIEAGEISSDKATSISHLTTLIGEQLLMQDVVSSEADAKAKCNEIYDALMGLKILKTAKKSTQKPLPASGAKSPPDAKTNTGLLLSTPIKIGEVMKVEVTKKMARDGEESKTKTLSSKAKKKLAPKEEKAADESSSTSTSPSSTSAATKKSTSKSSEADVDNPPLKIQHEEYFSSGAWELELSKKEFKEWTPSEVAVFVASIEKHGKSAVIFQKYASVIEADRINGALLLAGGPSHLVERAGAIVHKLTSVLKVHANRIFAAVKEYQDQERTRVRARESKENYWIRLRDGSESEQVVCEEYKTTAVGSYLRHALALHPRSKIRFSCLENPLKTNVKYINKMTCKVSTAEEEQFKVISVSRVDDPEVIERNFIYTKDKKDNKWSLIASVDFEQHGAAPSGHWHLNRAPNGDLMEHWGPSISQVFHGNSEKCPLWWLLIPVNKRYNKVPDREFLIRAAKT